MSQQPIPPPVRMAVRAISDRIPVETCMNEGVWHHLRASRSGRTAPSPIPRRTIYAKEFVL